MKKIAFILLVFCWPLMSWSGKLPAGFIEEELATKLNPIDLALAPDGRIFIAQKDGRILLFRDGKVLDNPFMTLEVDDTNERGLQSIVLDPDFENNGYFYLFYSHPFNLTNRVSRFTSNGDKVLIGSEVLLYEMDAVIGTVHNGGGMTFLQDGSLLFSVGDGSAGWRAQWDDQTHGKVLRIWPDGSIPDDNPKIYAGGKYDAIVAKGFRNPFNLAVNDDGVVFINDVGSHLFEEVNELEYGKNYGWPYLEGIRTTQQTPPDYKDPLHAYDHDTGCAVVGGAFCSNSNPMFPDEYKGKYFYSDYCKGYIKVVDPQTGDVVETFATEIDRPLRLLFDDEGRMYYFERAGLGGGSVNDNTSSSNGRLLRVTFTGNGVPVIGKDPGDVLVSIGEEARFEVSANGGQPLSYEWYINQNLVAGSDSSVLTLTDVQLAQDGSEVYCVVFNQEGRDTSNTATLSVTTNTRPEPSITLLSNDQYVAGSNLMVSGSAIDAEDGQMSSDNFVWWIDFHHDLHTHPALAPVAGLPSVDYAIPAIGEVDDNVWYRVYLSVTDAGGLSKTTFLDVFPKKINIRYESEPSGLEINIDGGIYVTPVDIPSVAGIEHVASAITFQIDDENAFVFDNWNGSSVSDQIQFDPEEDVTQLVNYEVFDLGEGEGLLGEYYDFHEGRPEFFGEPEFSRIDSVIDFMWEESPDNDLLGKDSFLVSWTGSIEPIFDGNYVFGVDYRTSARLFVGGEVLLDDWDINPRTYHVTDSIFLEGGRRYSIIFEMYKTEFGATAKLQWANSKMPMQLVPQKQLYSIDTSVNDGDDVTIKIGPNPTVDKIKLELVGDARVDADLVIYNSQGQLVLEDEALFRSGAPTKELDLTTWPSGVYILHLLQDKEAIYKTKILKQ